MDFHLLRTTAAVVLFSVQVDSIQEAPNDVICFLYFVYVELAGCESERRRTYFLQNWNLVFGKEKKQAVYRIYFYPTGYILLNISALA